MLLGRWFGTFDIGNIDWQTRHLGDGFLFSIERRVVLDLVMAIKWPSNGSSSSGLIVGIHFLRFYRRKYILIANLTSLEDRISPPGFAGVSWPSSHGDQPAALRLSFACFPPRRSSDSRALGTRSPEPLDLVCVSYRTSGILSEQIPLFLDR